MAIVLSVLNQKGGTAKTTTAVALSSKLALIGKRVLLMDVDPQANATMSLGVDSEALEKSMYDVFVRDVSLNEVIIASEVEGLHLAPGQVVLSKTDINLADRPRKQFKVADAIHEVEKRYDYVVLDCPPSFGLIPVNALVASHGVIIPMVPQYFSLEGLKQVNNSINSVKKELNPKLDITGILFCMVDTRLRITKPAIEMVRNHYGDKVFDILVRMSSKINEAHLAGKSIFEYDPKCRASIEYSALADEVLQKTGQAPQVHHLTPRDIITQIFNPN